MTDIIKKEMPWSGIILIVLGVALLLDQTHLIDIRLSQIIWGILLIFGFVQTIRGYRNNRKSKIFWGTVVFLFSLYFLLNTLDFVEMQDRMFVPTIFLIFGFAFLTVYLNDFSDVLTLILSALLISSGVFLILEDFGYFDWFDVRNVIKTYWPIILVILGLGMLFRKR